MNMSHSTTNQSAFVLHTGTFFSFQISSKPHLLHSCASSFLLGPHPAFSRSCHSYLLFNHLPSAIINMNCNNASTDEPANISNASKSHPSPNSASSLDHSNQSKLNLNLWSFITQSPVSSLTVAIVLSLLFPIGASRSPNVDQSIDSKSLLSRLVQNGLTTLQDVVNPSAWARSYLRKTLMQKLSQVPIFAVTNATGQPYLMPLHGGSAQVGLMYFNYEDAEQQLNFMRQSGSQDARLYAMGLDKAFQMVKAQPTPSGVKDPSGKEQLMYFRFFPAEKQVTHAKEIYKKTENKDFKGIPLFSAKGLTIQKDKETIVPLFFDKDDLEAAWKQVADSNPNLPKKPEIQITELFSLINAIQEKGHNHPDVKDLGFLPPRRSVEFMESQKPPPSFTRGKTARLHEKP